MQVEKDRIIERVYLKELVSTAADWTDVEGESFEDICSDPVEGSYVIVEAWAGSENRTHLLYRVDGRTCVAERVGQEEGKEWEIWEVVLSDLMF
jgi:hypothetical protein